MIYKVEDTYCMYMYSTVRIGRSGKKLGKLSLDSQKAKRISHVLVRYVCMYLCIYIYIYMYICIWSVKDPSLYHIKHFRPFKKSSQHNYQLLYLSISLGKVL